jgi:hypothetical protein
MRMLVSNERLHRFFRAAGPCRRIPLGGSAHAETVDAAGRARARTPGRSAVRCCRTCSATARRALRARDSLARHGYQGLELIGRKVDDGPHFVIITRYQMTSQRWMPTRQQSFWADS